MEGSDYDLIKAVGKGDEGAFECLMRRYRKSVLNFVYRHIGDRYMAEDLTQEVFLRTYLASARFVPTGKVRTWIFKIAYNLCLNEIKRMARLRRLRDELDAHPAITCESPAAGGARSGVEEVEAVLEALSRLPEPQRAALLLRAGEGLSYAEIGQVLSLSVSGVESLLFRARTNLRQIVQICGKG